MGVITRLFTRPAKSPPEQAPLLDAPHGRAYPDAGDQLERSLRQPTACETQPIGQHDAPLQVPNRSGIGICCSGGGIRSAAYNLGALQELSRSGKLQQADYLSAVSGGAYIAAALAIATRHSDGKLLGGRPAFAPGSEEEHYLRNRCSYLAAGLTGKARLLAAVLVGLLVNLAVIGLALYSLGRPLGWAYAGFYEELALGAQCVEQGQFCFRSVNLVIPERLVTIVKWAGGAGLLVVGINRMLRPWDPRWHRFLGRTGAALLGFAAVLAVVGILIPQILAVVRTAVTATTPVPAEGITEVVLGTSPSESAKDRSTSLLTLLTGGGLASVVAAVLTQVRSPLRDLAGTAKAAVGTATRFSRLNSRLRLVLLYLVGAVLGPLAVLATLLVVTNNAAAANPFAGGYAPSQWIGSGEVWTWALVVLALVVVYLYGDLTRWSMHPFYKRRLASAFALKRTRDSRGETVARELDYRYPLTLSEFKRERFPIPFPELLICAAANVSDEGATPPGSGVMSFVFSPSEIGGPLVGGMATSDYEQAIARSGLRNGKRPKIPHRDISMLAAVAVSGAAIAPSMGKMTKAPLRFLMALGNVRLGVWLPNPRIVAQGQWRALDRRRFAAQANPRPLYLVRELLGRNSLNSRFLYVSDGGHYENLGLVELLRRGCTEIYCFDAAGGSVQTYSTLGEAIALARTEARVEIDLKPTILRGDGSLAAGTHVVGTFHYLDDPERKGRIVYVKTGVTEDAPWDVRAFGEKDTKFPVHPTFEQLYTGERFEAYRVLGAHAASKAVAAMGTSALHTPRSNVHG